MFVVVPLAAEVSQLLLIVLLLFLSSLDAGFERSLAGLHHMVAQSKKASPSICYCHSSS